MADSSGLTPTVTVVTPVLNQRAYIEAAVQSVLEQDYPQVEYIVIDGGSTDGTLEILNKYRDRITLISEADSGQSNAINKGLYLARGEILAWLNADDLYLPGAISLVVQKFSDQPEVACVYGDCDYIDPGGQVLAQFPAKAFDLQMLVVTAENFIPQPAAFFRRSCLNQAGYLDEKLEYLMDYELWLRIASVGRFEYIPRTLAQTRLHANAKSVAAFARFGDELVGVIDDYFSRPDLPEMLLGTRQEAVSKASLRAAHAAFWAGEYSSAARHLKLVDWQYLSRRQKLSRVRLGGLALIGRLGLPVGAVLRRLKTNPYTMGHGQEGAHG
jgi:glycosyltransferase involved in cell wall biosynthesis